MELRLKMMRYLLKGSIIQERFEATFDVATNLVEVIVPNKKMPAAEILYGKMKFNQYNFEIKLVILEIL